MRVKPLLNTILSNDRLTHGLSDPEARMLVEWLVEQAEHFARVALSDELGLGEVQRLCRRGRAIGRFVLLWCYARERGAAVQLAAAEGFTWPLPTTAIDACELMHRILTSETARFAA